MIVDLALKTQQFIENVHLQYSTLSELPVIEFLKSWENMKGQISSELPEMDLRSVLRRAVIRCEEGVNFQ